MTVAYMNIYIGLFLCLAAKHCPKYLMFSAWNISLMRSSLTCLCDIFSSNVSVGVSLLGSAMEALSAMQAFLRSQPKRFPSLPAAIEWA